MRELVTKQASMDGNMQLLRKRKFIKYREKK